MAALRFLKLIDLNGKPSSQLRALVASKGEQRASVLKDIVTGSFGFIFQGSLEPQNATYAQLEELFHSNFQCTNDVARKCIKFFIALSNDAGIVLSPFITKRSKTTHPHISGGTMRTRKKNNPAIIRNAIVPQNKMELSSQRQWQEMLLNKFPTFDPSWNDEIKMKWFSAFDELIKRAPS